MTSQPTHLKASDRGGHVPYRSPPSPLSCSFAVGAGTNFCAPGDYFSTSPFLSSFFPPAEPSSKSLPSSLIPLSLLHRHNASSTQTNHRHRGDLSRRRAISDSPTTALTVMLESSLLFEDASSPGCLSGQLKLHF